MSENCMHRHAAIDYLQVRKGNFPVIENHHTVLLNWNQQTLPVLKQVRGAGLYPLSNSCCTAVYTA